MTKQSKKKQIPTHFDIQRAPEGVRVKLWKHQRAALESRAASEALWFETGTGKTITAIGWLAKRYAYQEGFQKTLILAPNSLTESWSREILKVFPEWKGKVVLLADKTSKKRIVSLNKGLDENKEIFITNHEAIHTVLWGEIAKKKWYCLVIDEAHCFKNYKAKQTLKLHKLADEINYKLILTGSPILRELQDIWAQLRILDRKIVGSNFYNWQASWFVNKNQHAPAHVKWPNWQPTPVGLEHIQNLIATHGHSAKKSEVLDLPPLIESQQFVELTDEQQELYSQMSEQFVAAYDAHQEPEFSSASTVMTKMLRLAQISSGLFCTDDGQTRYLKSDKFQALLERLEGLVIGEKQQVIVWCWFVANYARVQSVCDELKLTTATIVGGQTHSERTREIDSFVNGKSQVLIANPGAGGTGLNLQNAQTAIWLERSWSFGDRIQAQARNYRGGSERHKSILQLDFITKDTVEEPIVQCLQDKWTMQQLVTTVRGEYGTKRA